MIIIMTYRDQAGQIMTHRDQAGQIMTHRDQAGQIMTHRDQAGQIMTFMIRSVGIQTAGRWNNGEQRRLGVGKAAKAGK